MATLKEYYNSGDDSFRSCYGANVFIGQTFEAESSYKIGSVKLKLYRVGSPGTITVSIQGVSSSVPDDSDLTSGTYDGNTLTTDTNGEWIEISFSSEYSLISGTDYAIVVKATSGDVSNLVAWRADNSSPAYTNGSYVFTVGGAGNWSTGVTYDMMFENYVFVASAPDDKVYSRKLVAISNNEVWYNSTESTMAIFSDATGLDVNNALSATEAFQKLFIANGTNLYITDFVNSKLSTNDAGANPCTHGMQLTGGNSGATMIVDYADAVTDDSSANIYGLRDSTATFTSGETVTGTNGDGDAVSFVTSAVEDSPPHWYAWTPFGNDTTTYGSMPSSAYLIVRYRGRLVLSGHPTYPHQWWMSKVADPWHWIYNTNDPLSAISGQDADAGEIGDIVRGLIPYGDDYLLIMGANSIHLVTGDPAAGGRIDELSNTIGLYSYTSWTKDKEDNLYFFGTNGLYKMEGGRGKPMNLSIGVLPTLIEDLALNPSSDRVVVQYDPLRDGIVITKTGTDGTNTGYWYSLKTQGFYPEAYPEECGVFSSTFYNADTSTYRSTVYGCSDGYIRYFKDTAKSDDVGASNEAISSYVTLPSMMLGDGLDKEGKIDQIIIESSGGASGGDYSDTDSISYDVYAADDAETLIEDIRDGASSALTGSVSGTGRKARIRQRVRGMYGTIKLSNATISSGWAVNRIMYNNQLGGSL